MSHPFPLTVQVIVAGRSGGVCERCRTRRATVLHHRRPKGMGGQGDAATDLPSNAAHLDNACHVEIHANPAESYDTGWLVRRNGRDLPEEVPVVGLDGWARFLTDEGGVVNCQGGAA